MQKNEYFIKLTNYFRRSIIDSERLSPNTKSLLGAVKPSQFGKVKRDEPFAICSSAWQSGFLDIDIVKDVFKVLKVGKKIQQVEIVLMPRVDLNKVLAGKAIGQQSPIITPIVTQVRLNREGKLQPSDKPPFVPREWLAPNQSDQVPFGTLTTVDEFTEKNPFNAASWGELTDYCDRMIASLLADKAINSKDELSHTLFDRELLSEYQLRQDISLVLLKPPIIAGFHILKIYDAILNGTKLNQLFRQTFSVQPADTMPYENLTHNIDDCLFHVGQMTAEFPLADKQRNAVHYFGRMKKGDLLTINGPPGTGKTTLLRSVVANEWVRAALLQKEPPIIVAASSSNQAVTNILDSFSKIEETNIESSIKGRWLPHIDTYGVYACGDNKANSHNLYAYVTKKGEGIMQKMESDTSIDDMKQHFLGLFNIWHDGSVIDDVKQAEALLHNELRQCITLQHNLQQQFLITKQQMAICKKKYGSLVQLDAQLRKLVRSKQDLEIRLEDNRALLAEFLLQWQERTWFELIFSFIPSIKKRLWLRNEILARKRLLLFDTLDSGEVTDACIRQSISNIEKSLVLEVSELDAKYGLAKSFQDKITVSREKLTELLRQASIEDEIDMLTYSRLVNKVDTQLRFKAFKLAVHYWEARWLDDVEEVNNQPRTPAERIATYKRYAKLTPCMVATFNMLPNFFEVSEKSMDGWKSTPLVDAADLLIIDEAGQALPHVAAASLLIAKKALLVGDIHQIEPVWSLSKGIDKANLALTKLIDEQLEYEPFWLDSQMTASFGNLMKVAHRQSRYCQFEDLERGLFLTEHRRCYDSIIDYCNKLVYKGHLEPLRGESIEKQLLPTMGFIHHESLSQQRGTSRINSEEAKLICLWIIDNKKILGDELLKGTVAIITPFKMQEKIIRQSLKEHGLDGIRVGTVHVFQGAECDIVLFSSVYASNDGGGSKFYDRGSHMMNVSVSRAKNSFIVFGDKRVFGAGASSSPSGLLKEYLTSDFSLGSLANSK